MLEQTKQNIAESQRTIRNLSAIFTGGAAAGAGAFIARKALGQGN